MCGESYAGAFEGFAADKTSAKLKADSRRGPRGGIATAVVIHQLAE